MNRLTEFHNGVWGMSTQAIKNGYDRYSVFSKLAAYEDTGLEPEEISPLNKELVDVILEQLKEYEDLEEQSLLIKLPCKVGDTVWSTDDCMEEFVPWCTYFDLWMLRMWNKTFFLTREEAEKALESICK